jgi:uncharacterized protein YggU (UPF0235/DUF167 family)
VPERPTLTVRAHPRAAAAGIGPWQDGVLHVRVTAPPADGRANDAVRRAVAKALHLTPGRVRLVAGERGRTKRFELDGIAPEALAARLAGIGPAD